MPSTCGIMAAQPVKNCCRCNKTGKCRNCACVKAGSKCHSCLPSRLGNCENLPPDFRTISSIATTSASATPSLPDDTTSSSFSPSSLLHTATINTSSAISGACHPTMLPSSPDHAETPERCVAPSTSTISHQSTPALFESLLTLLTRLPSLQHRYLPTRPVLIRTSLGGVSNGKH